ncbi:Legumain like [Fasciola gigantica]|uniref:Hemoglobinase n=1 Tax=Fasciola gigantica TaxID=46835 RepID=A0A504YGV2_FASGI|nr:Legumain like [Fasciola gigantica]
MQFRSVFLSLLITSTVFLEVSEGKNWAVLAAGSNGWPHYRHQADVCHAYQLLRKNGFPPENIITFMYDDIADNEKNPYPGKVFHDYNHKDVYEGVKVDYSGLDISADTFVEVLTGQQELKDQGNRVLESGPDDNVFIYFTDHGARRLLLFPYDALDWEYLHETLSNMTAKKMYNKILFYVEAAFAGSMFENNLPTNIGVLAMTATNEHESNYATFCDDAKIKSCLADEFSYQWMADIEKNKLSQRKIGEHFRAVKEALTHSHVKLFGDKKILDLPLSDFFTYGPQEEIRETTTDRPIQMKDESIATQAHVISLAKQLKESKSPRQMKLAHGQLHRALELSKMARETMDEIVNAVTTNGPPNGKHNDKHAYVECYRTAYKQYENKCLSIYQVPEVSNELEKLDRLCEQGYDAKVIVQAIFTTCA